MPRGLTTPATAPAAERAATAQRLGKPKNCFAFLCEDLGGFFLPRKLLYVCKFIDLRLRKTAKELLFIFSDSLMKTNWSSIFGVTFFLLFNDYYYWHFLF